MLIGSYKCTTDAKGRLNFPAKLRADLGTRFVITRSLTDPCLNVHSLEEWARVEEKLHALPIVKAGNIIRMLSGCASEAEPDAQGRVVIPTQLRTYANLEKDVVVIGASTHCEIWNKDKWEALCSALDSETIADVMNELGF